MHPLDRPAAAVTQMLFEQHDVTTVTIYLLVPSAISARISCLLRTGQRSGIPSWGFLSGMTSQCCDPKDTQLASAILDYLARHLQMVLVLTFISSIPMAFTRRGSNFATVEVTQIAPSSS